MSKKKCEYLHGVELGEHNNQPWFAEFALKAIAVVNFSFGGTHHVQSPKWELGHLRFSIYGGISTWDYNAMTKLVVSAHRECVRVEVHAHTFRQLRVSISRRVRFEDAGEYPMCTGHPTLKEHLAKLGEDM